MNPIIVNAMSLLNPGFTVFGLQVRWYGVIIAVSMVVAVLTAMRNCKKKNIKSDDIILLALIVIPLSILGARIYYCLFSGYTYSFKEFFEIWNGGMAIYGGVIGGVVGLGIFCLAKKKNFFDYADVIAPCLLLAQAIGRWGNFVNQEAYGSLVTNESLQWFPFSVYIEAVGEWHLATFFYESLWNLVGFILLMIILYKTNKKGLTTAFYFIIYGTGRIWIEGLRTDSLFIGTSGIRVSQLLSGILVVAGVVYVSIILLKLLKEKKAKNQNITKENG